MSNVQLAENHQRLLDLVRQQRIELHDANLITDREYADLAQVDGAVVRLESYDAVRKQLAAERGKVEELKAIWTYRIGGWMSPLELIKHTAKRKKITSQEMFIEWCEDYAPKISALAEPTQPTPEPSAGETVCGLRFVPLAIAGHVQQPHRLYLELTDATRRQIEAMAQPSAGEKENIEAYLHGNSRPLSQIIAEKRARIAEFNARKPRS